MGNDIRSVDWCQIVKQFDYQAKTLLSAIALGQGIICFIFFYAAIYLAQKLQFISSNLMLYYQHIFLASVSFLIVLVFSTLMSLCQHFLILN